MQDFTKLLVWQKAKQFEVHIVRTFTVARCRILPGLRGQIIRSTNAIAATIAEGCGKVSSRELARYADMACGSIAEVKNHLASARNQGLISAASHERLMTLAEELRRMAVSLSRAVRRRANARGIEELEDRDEAGSDSEARQC
jgi:four helix bundle protein